MFNPLNPRAIVEDHFGPVEEVVGPDHNGDYAVLLKDGRPAIVYHDGRVDLAVGTWDELLAAGSI